MDQDKRPEPEAFLDLAPHSQRGLLKIYLGAAAGVGKTCRMLEEAHQMRQRGVDVVIGFIETHGRAETADRAIGLEIVPRRRLDYRGVTIEEMDLDAILARKPEWAIVDELPHTNAAGSRHEKRWQDVEELLAAGINVITAMNIQHLESLNAVVRRITGVEVRETVPDSVLARADQIVNVDLSIEGLRERLREGKIYPADHVEQALKNFFKPSNLTSLRELALREIARGLNRRREDLETRRREGGRRTLVADRLMVGLSSNPRDSASLLRKASRIAGQLNADWYAVHVETPAESVARIDTRNFVKLLDNINLAGDLGAETVWLKSDDVVRALVEFAREHGVTKIIVGRTSQPFWRRMLGRTVPLRLVAAAPDLDVEIAAVAAPEEES
ncbi:histidine kinase [bacterium]|jgi:two-component system sensor histidine kinase KdpD|nr:histidine kinase [bacterium]